MSTARLLALLLVALASCGGCESSPVSRLLGPGSSLSLVSVARAALACESELLWSVVEPGGGSVTPQGLYTAPPCAGFVPGTYTVRVSGCGRTSDVLVSVAEQLESVAIVCGVAAGTTCCQPPTPCARGTCVTTSPGKSVQFYAAVSYSCRVVYAPAAPPPQCP